MREQLGTGAQFHDNDKHYDQCREMLLTPRSKLETDTHVQQARTSSAASNVQGMAPLTFYQQCADGKQRWQ